MLSSGRYKYYNPNDPSHSVPIAGADTDPFVVFASLPVLKDKREDIVMLDNEAKSTKEEAQKAKSAADVAWLRALEAQRAAKRAEAKADMTGNAEDIKVAGELAGKAMEKKKTSETFMEASLKASDAAARAESAKLSAAYQAVMQGDARHFEEACKLDKEILMRLNEPLRTAQAFPPILISTPLEVGLPYGVMGMPGMPVY